MKKLYVLSFLALSACNDSTSDVTAPATDVATPAPAPVAPAPIAAIKVVVSKRQLVVKDGATVIAYMLGAGAQPEEVFLQSTDGGIFLINSWTGDVVTEGVVFTSTDCSGSPLDSEGLFKNKGRVLRTSAGYYSIGGRLTNAITIRSRMSAAGVCSADNFSPPSYRTLNAIANPLGFAAAAPIQVEVE